MELKDSARSAARGAANVAKAAITAPKEAAVGFWRGITYPFKGAKLVYLQHPRLIKWWIWPILITLLAIGLVVWGTSAVYGDLVEMVWSAPTGQGFWAGVARFFHSVVEVLVFVLLLLAGVVAVAGISSVVSAPFDDFLSEEVEKIVAGREGPPFSMKTLMRDVVRTVGLEVVKLLIYLSVMGPLFVLSLLVPGIGQIVYSVFGFLFTAYYFAVDFIDWPASRQNRSVAWRFSLLREHSLPMLGFGTGVWLFLFVPLVNLLFRPAAVAGGTMLFLDLERDYGAGDGAAGDGAPAD